VYFRTKETTTLAQAIERDLACSPSSQVIFHKECKSSGGVVNLDAPVADKGGGVQEGGEAEGGNVVAEEGDMEEGRREHPEYGDNLEDTYVYVSTEAALEGGLRRGEQVRPSLGSRTSSYHGQADKGTAAPDKLGGNRVLAEWWLEKAGDPARTLGLNLPWTRKWRWFILRYVCMFRDLSHRGSGISPRFILELENMR